MKEENQYNFKSTDTISTVVGRGTYIVGPVTIKNSARIDGHIEGEVTVDHEVFIGEGGIVNGKIICEIVVIGGKVTGSVQAALRVILEEKAELHGDIYTGNLKIANGAVFNGFCYMLTDSEKTKLTNQPQ